MLGTTLIILMGKYLIWDIAALAGLYFLFVARKRTKRRMLILSVISLPLVYLVGFVAGRLYDNPRPFVVTHTQPLIAHAANNGFPSDHMLLAAALASIVLVYNRPVGLLLWGLALLVGVARVWAGVHHWLDIAGGALIGGLVVALVYLCIRKALWYRG